MDNVPTIDKERELLDKIVSGDKEAFGALYDFYAPRIFRFIRLKVGSQTVAEDLSSESFLRTWEYLQKEEKEIEESFQALLYKIARNLIIDHYKRKSSQELMMDDDFKEFLENQQARDEVASKEAVVEIRKALVNIKEEYQDVLIFYYIDELSIPEIARILNKSQGAIRVLIHRGLGSLKKCLQGEN
jgi:RNA polymerase sigma-70 factor (ECF subfamily)